MHLPFDRQCSATEPADGTDALPRATDDQVASLTCAPH